MNKNRNSANIRLDEKLSTDARDCSQMFSCAYMMYTLLANVQSQDCEANSKVTLSARGELRAPVQRLALSSEKQAGVLNSLLLEQSRLSQIEILHS